MTEEIIERLRSLDLSGGSHSRLSAIASCFLEPAFGWTRGACETLRDKLIETMEGKYGNDDNDNFDDCDCAHYRCDQHGRQVSYDVPGTSLSDLYGIWQDGEESENKDSESARKMTKSAEIGKSDERVRQLEHDVEMWRDRAEDMRMKRDELQIERDELQEKNRHLAEKCDEMLVLLSNRAMNAKSDQERRIEKLVRQRDELRVKLKEIGDIANG